MIIRVDRDAHRRVVTFGYEMRLAADDRKLATGHTKHIFLGADFRPPNAEKYSKCSELGPEIG